MTFSFFSRDACLHATSFFRDDWKKAFKPRDLVALSVQPLLIFPTHYTGEPGYITDTEDSNVIDLTAEGAQVSAHPGGRENQEPQDALADFARGELGPDMGKKQEL